VYSVHIHLNPYIAVDTCTFICVRPIQVDKDNQSEFSFGYFIYVSCFIKKEYILRETNTGSIPTVIQPSTTHAYFRPIVRNTVNTYNKDRQFANHWAIVYSGIANLSIQTEKDELMNEYGGVERLISLYINPCSMGKSSNA
jgi:hypothetical protein